MQWGTLWSGLCLTATMTLPRAADAQPPRCAAPARVAGGASNVHSRYVENHLRPPVIRRGDRSFTIADRLRQYDVPGVSVAVIQHGRVAWARGWGVRDLATCAPVTPDTAFQAASISKVVTAMVALRLVEQGKIGLDQDITGTLRSWQLPLDPHLAPAGVTLHQLLSHTAGLSVHGFTGYPPDAPLPTPAEILDGTQPANSPPVRSVLPAGGQFSYSGGGYVMAQLALSDASGMPFAELARREVLGPLAMSRSGFAMPPTDALRANMALGSVGGKPLPGGFKVYPELAPAGLWTSAGDLARVIIDLQASAAGRQGHRLSPVMTRQMMTPIKDNWGLGLASYGGAHPRFMHDGVNEGFQSFMIAYVGRSDGIVVLTNGGDGRRLIGEIVRAVATDYGWSEIAAPTTKERMLTPGQLARAAGRFEGGDLKVDLKVQPEGLFARLVGGAQSERLIALSPSRFRSESLGVTVEFDRDFQSCTIIEGAPPMKLSRIKADTLEGPRP